MPGHLAMEMLVAATGSKLNHVPYRGPGQVVQDVLGGAVPCGFLATPVVGPHVREGKLTALAVSGSMRTSSLPNVPTMTEAGVPGYDATFFELLAAPKGMLQIAIERLQQAVEKALAKPDLQAKPATADLAPVASKPA